MTSLQCRCFLIFFRKDLYTKADVKFFKETFEVQRCSVHVDWLPDCQSPYSYSYLIFTVYILYIIYILIYISYTNHFTGYADVLVYIICLYSTFVWNLSVIITSTFTLALFFLTTFAYWYMLRSEWTTTYYFGLSFKWPVVTNPDQCATARWYLKPLAISSTKDGGLGQVTVGWGMLLFRVTSVLCTGVLSLTGFVLV